MPASREAPETLWLTWVLTSGDTEVRGMWVLSPGEIAIARKTVVPRTGVLLFILFDYDCINWA